MSDMVRTFTALADPTRLRIVEHLIRHGEAAAGDLTDLSALSTPAVSRHLKILREAGLVRRRAEGTHRVYSVRPQALRNLADWSARNQVFWDQGLDRLEQVLAHQEEAQDGATDA